jgi:hypothetical protein
VAGVAYNRLAIRRRPGHEVAMLRRNAVGGSTCPARKGGFATGDSGPRIGAARTPGGQ